MIKDIAQIEKELLDRDGSFRDINFENIAFESAIALIDCLVKIYMPRSATNSKGDDILNLIVNGNIESQFEIQPNYIHATFGNDNVLIRYMQIFLDWDQTQKVSAELTFSPEDIDENFSFSLFEEFIAPFIAASGTTHYYVRYENAGWEFGDLSKHAGVIYHGKIDFR